MFCDNCLQNVADKLVPDEIVILEYLHRKGAIIPQYTISRKIIKEELDMTDHICYTAINRLECFELIERQARGKSSKYYVTKAGEKVIIILDKKLQEVN